MRRRPPTRGPARRWRRFVGAARRSAHRCSCATRPRRSTCWRTACPRTRACSRRRASITPTCSPGAAASVDLLPFTALGGRAAGRGAPTALAGGRLRPLRDLGRLERDRRDHAARASSPSSRTATAQRSAWTPPSSHRTCRSTWTRSGSTTSRSRATSSMRPSASAFWSLAASGIAPGRAAAARRGRGRARGGRPRRLVRRARAFRGRHAERLRRDRARRRLRRAARLRHGRAGGSRKQTLGALLRERLAAVPGAPSCSRSGAARTSRASRWPRSTSAGIEAGRASRAGWPRSTRSRCAPARSARTRSCGTCAVSRASTGGGAVRASLGLGSAIDDVEALADALEALIAARDRRAGRATRPAGVQLLRALSRSDRALGPRDPFAGAAVCSRADADMSAPHQERSRVPAR